MNVDEMEAGRELDALVAERVMGHVPCDKWTPVLHPVAGWLKNCQCQTCYPADDPAYYSTNIAAAWEVVEKLRLIVGPCSDGINDLWFATRPNSVTVIPSTAKTAPLAICRAALKVMAK